MTSTSMLFLLSQNACYFRKPQVIQLHPAPGSAPAESDTIELFSSIVLSAMGRLFKAWLALTVC